MRVHFHRTDPHGGYEVLLWRRDGLTVRLRGDDHDRRIPHELAHLVTEQEFRLDRGVLGCIAAGAMFTGMSVVGGRARRDSHVRSRTVIRTYAADLGLAEVLVGVVHEGFERDDPPEAIHGGLVGAWSALRVGSCPYQPNRVRRCVESLRVAGIRWRQVPEGGHLALRWEPGAERLTVLAS